MVAGLAACMFFAGSRAPAQAEGKYSLLWRGSCVPPGVLGICRSAYRLISLQRTSSFLFGLGFDARGRALFSSPTTDPTGPGGHPQSEARPEGTGGYRPGPVEDRGGRPACLHRRRRGGTWKWMRLNWAREPRGSRHAVVLSAGLPRRHGTFLCSATPPGGWWRSPPPATRSPGYAHSSSSPDGREFEEDLKRARRAGRPGQSRRVPRLSVSERRHGSGELVATASLRLSTFPCCFLLRGLRLRAGRTWPADLVDSDRADRRGGNLPFSAVHLLPPGPAGRGVSVREPACRDQCIRGSTTGQPRGLSASGGSSATIASPWRVTDALPRARRR